MSDATRFDHREHVRTAFGMLRQYSFDEAIHRFSNLLRRVTAQAGRPEAFNQTITIAFLALIAERIALQGAEDFDSFAEANPELFRRGLLERWYCPDRLRSKLAHDILLLPDRGTSVKGRCNR